MVYVWSFLQDTQAMGSARPRLIDSTSFINSRARLPRALPSPRQRAVLVLSFALYTARGQPDQGLIDKTKISFTLIVRLAFVLSDCAFMMEYVFGDFGVPNRLSL